MDILFYYTGAKTFEDPQPSARASLGGFPSSSKIANGELSNLFFDIGLLSDVKFEVKCIVLKNVGVTSISNLDLWFEKTSNLFDIKVGAEWLGESKTDVELLNSTYSIPYGIEFHEANIEEGPVRLGHPDTGIIQPNEAIVIWLKRIILRDEIKSKLSCDNLYKSHVDNTPIYIPENSIEVKLSYDKS